MSKYDDEIDTEHAICPYCQHESFVEMEDYTEDTRQEECENCGKLYWLSQSFSVTHHTTPDCEINGDSHNYKLRTLIKSGRSAYFCETCGKCRLPD